MRWQPVICGLTLAFLVLSTFGSGAAAAEKKNKSSKKKAEKKQEQKRSTKAQTKRASKDKKNHTKTEQKREAKAKPASKPLPTPLSRPRPRAAKPTPLPNPRKPLTHPTPIPQPPPTPDNRNGLIPGSQRPPAEDASDDERSLRPRESKWPKPIDPERPIRMLPPGGGNDAEPGTRTRQKDTGKRGIRPKGRKDADTPIVRYREKKPPPTRSVDPPPARPGESLPLVPYELCPSCGFYACRCETDLQIVYIDNMPQPVHFGGDWLDESLTQAGLIAASAAIVMNGILVASDEPNSAVAYFGFASGAANILLAVGGRSTHPSASLVAGAASIAFSFLNLQIPANDASGIGTWATGPALSIRF